MAPAHTVRMPAVSPNRDVRQCFAEARRGSAEADGTRRVVVIAPDGTLVSVPVPPPGKADASLIRDVRAALAPEDEPVTGLTITAINFTQGIQKVSRSFFKMLELMPNLSYLVGAAYLGNTVVSFEGHSSSFAVGCEETDVLILDDAMVPFLQADWAAVALKLLRQPRILQFGRDGRLSRVTRLVAIEEPEKER
jgi:hypothetical protein